MKTRRKEILDTITLLKGLEIDINEGYKKLIKSQFGKTPGRGFGELIQNLIDSYPSDVPMEKRRGEINTYKNMISITDYGEGLDRKKIKLLLTLGGTDKDKDPSKIGMFGIGFFSIFNPKLGTRKVKVTTNCEGYMVEITFLITDPENKPEIRTNILRRNAKYQTKIEVLFNNAGSVDQCVRFAKNALQYYPCNIKIDGVPFNSLWNKARQEKNKIYTEKHITGFLSRSGWRDYVKMLCKYEYILQLPANSFPNGGHKLNDNLSDFFSKKTPYVPGYTATINNNRLSVTISRDSFYLDKNFRESVSFLNGMLMDRLEDMLCEDPNKNVIMANQFIFREELSEYLVDPDSYKGGNKTTKSVIMMLARAKVYNICDSKEKYSLNDFSDMLSDDLPFYFSEQKSNLVWLGGNFKHDFIVLPDLCKAFNGAPEFYNILFSCLFDDIVDLDTIRFNSKKIKELVDRQVVNKSALSPECRFVGEKMLDMDQMELLDEINGILENEEIKMVISEAIDIPVRNIKPLFFEVEEEGAYISTGLFNSGGEPLSDQFVTNFEEQEKKDKECYYEPIDIVLGLRLDHPFIHYLIASKNSHRAYYAMTYIAHELALCQKLLVPHSPLFHLVKEKTASGMRKALINNLINSRVA